MRYIKMFASLVMLVFLLTTAVSVQAAASDDWVWISSDSKYSKYYSPARVRVLENSAARQDVRFDALSASINELKQQARESNDLLRELAQRP